MSVLTLARTVAEMIAGEHEVMSVLSCVEPLLQRNRQAADAAQEIERTAQTHRKLLQERLTALGAREEPAETGTVRFIVPPEDNALGLSRALRSLDAVCTWVSLGYAVLHAQAHRFFDLPTADLAEAHLRDYVKAAKLIDSLISDVVVWELGQTGQNARGSVRVTASLAWMIRQ